MTIIKSYLTFFSYFLLVIEDYIGVGFVLSMMLVDGSDYQHRCMRCKGLVKLSICLVFLQLLKWFINYL